MSQKDDAAGAGFLIAVVIGGLLVLTLGWAAMRRWQEAPGESRGAAIGSR